MPRKKHVKDEYEKQLQLFHKSSARHVLVVEAAMSEDMKRRAFGLADCRATLSSNRKHHFIIASFSRKKA